MGVALSTQAVHADDHLNEGPDVAPPLHVATTFRYPKDPDRLVPVKEVNASNDTDAHVYSRVTAPNTTRLEAILTTVLKGPTVTYSSGLSAFHAMVVFLNPKAIAIGEGYHGCHGVLDIHQKLTGLKKLDLDCDPSMLQAGDIVHVETPLNPTGQVRNLKHYADIAHARGAFLTVDATFGPPPLQDPFLWGADIVMHSGTKYIGGHSDMLCGILSINPVHNDKKWAEKLKEERTYLGNVMGNMESWLGIRSIRTLAIRVERQASNAECLVKWLNAALNPHLAEKTGTDPSLTMENIAAVRAVVSGVQHGSLQAEDIKDGWIQKQMPSGYGPVFALVMKTKDFARRLPSKLEYFHHATSLGGVESLIEWRCMSDDTVDERLMRVSIGIEGWHDLREDLVRGFKALAEEKGYTTYNQV